MFCNKCGAQLNENAKFCAACGTQVAVNQQVQHEEVQQPDPFAQVTPVQPVTEPSAPVDSVQQQNPFAQPADPVQQQNPFAQPVDPVQQQNPFAQPADPVQQQNPFAQPAESVQQQNPFAQPADPVQQQNPFVQPASIQQSVDPAQQSNPFVQPAPIQQSADPFAPVDLAQQSNPFVQPAPVQQSADPFAQQAPVQQSEPFAQQAPAQQWGPMMKPEKSNKGSKTPLIIGLICGALTIVVILLVVILFACSGGGASSPEDAAKVYFEAISNKDFGDLKDVMYPPVFNEAYDEDVFEKDEFMNLISLSSYPDRYYLSDENAKITFSNVKVTDKENVSSSKVDSYNSSLKKQDGYITISKAAEIEGTVTIKVDGESKEYRFDATVVLAGGDWYIADMDID